MVGWIANASAGLLVIAPRSCAPSIMSWGSSRPAVRRLIKKCMVPFGKRLRRNREQENKECRKAGKKHHSFPDFLVSLEALALLPFVSKATRTIIYETMRRFFPGLSFPFFVLFVSLW